MSGPLDSSDYVAGGAGHIKLSCVCTVLPIWYRCSITFNAFLKKMLS
jgi:hypothetical protein